MGMCADKAFLTAIPVFIDPKTPYKPAQMCDCCRGASEMIRSRRHADLPLPFVITKVHAGLPSRPYAESTLSVCHVSYLTFNDGALPACL